ACHADRFPLVVYFVCDAGSLLVGHHEKARVAERLGGFTTRHEYRGTENFGVSRQSELCRRTIRRKAERRTIKWLGGCDDNRGSQQERDDSDRLVHGSYFLYRWS